MKKALILHGLSKNREFVAEKELPVTAWNWLGWLQQKFNLAGVNCQNVLFPNSWSPDKNYEDDAEAFSSFRIDENTRVIAWSAGTTFILKWLSLHPDVRGLHLVLVSPYSNTEPVGDIIGDFFGVPSNQNGVMAGYSNGEFPDNLTDRFKRVDIVYSENDPIVSIPKFARILAEKFPKANIHMFENKGHFTRAELGTTEFPELWEICKSETA